MMRAVFTSRPLTSADQTAREMLRISEQYSGDLGEFAKMPIEKFFDHVRKLPYRADPPRAETLSRPAHTLKADFPFRDCDDKAILMGAWCHANGIPFGFYASSARPDGRLHHVWTVANFPGGPMVLDPTYRHHRIGTLPQREKLTKIQFLQGSNMYLNTFEGGAPMLGFSIGKKLRKVGKAAVKSTVSAAKATKSAAAQVRRGNVLTAGKTLVKAGAGQQIRQTTAAVRATKSAAAQVRRGNVLTAGKTLVKAGAQPAQKIAAQIGGAMPKIFKDKIKAVLLKITGGKVTQATKAAVLPTVTAAALAIPGIQPFAPGVSVVVNMALDELIAAAKKKAESAVKGAARTVTAAKKAPVLVSQAAPTARAQATAAALRERMEEARDRAHAEAERPAPQARAAALRERMEEAAENVEPSGMSAKKKAIIAVGVGAAGVILYKATRKKGRS